MVTLKCMIILILNADFSVKKLFKDLATFTIVCSLLTKVKIYIDIVEIFKLLVCYFE
jgi:hypothetical protein